MAPWKIPCANFQKTYKNRIKAFLEFPRIQPSQVDYTFDDVLRIEKDGSLIKGSIKVSPHFDEKTTAFYLKTNEELSKSLASIKTKEQCEQLKVLLALDLKYLNGCDYTWEKPDGTSLPKSCNPLVGTIRSGEAAAAADESASDSEGAQPLPPSKEAPRLQVAKDPYDFMFFWDPGNPESIPWDDLSYDDDANFTAKRSYHAAAIFVFYSDALQLNHPDFYNKVHAGWQAHFKQPMCAGDLDQVPTVGDGAYTDEEVTWCKETTRYLRSQLHCQGLIDRGLPGARVAVRASARSRRSITKEAAPVAKSTDRVPATSSRKRSRKDGEPGEETASDSDLESTVTNATGKSKQGSQGRMRVKKHRYLWHFSAYFLA
jgi:hypothetical protein